MTIEFLKLRRRGVDLEGAIQLGAEKKFKKLDTQFHAAIEDLGSREQALETQISPLVDRASALSLTQPEQEQLKAEKEKLTRLQKVQTQLQEALHTKQQELKTDQENSVALRNQIQTLQPALHQASSFEREESFLRECGSRLSQKLSQR